MLEFDNAGILDKTYIIRFFCKNLRLSIKAQMEQHGRALDDWEELVQKPVNVEAKVSFLPPFMLIIG